MTDTTPTPENAPLLNHISLTPFGSPILKVHDVDNDGEYEFLFLQSAGELSSKSASEKRDDVSARDRALFCLTALKKNGSILWQVGTPYNVEEQPYVSRGGEQMLLVDDVDGDGHNEVLTINGSRLVMLEGKTGREKIATILPSDNYVDLRTAKLTDATWGRQIICKANGNGDGPCDEANPVMIFNPDLTVFQEPFAVPCKSNVLQLVESNQESIDQLLIGNCLITQSLNRIQELASASCMAQATEIRSNSLYQPIGQSSVPIIHFCTDNGFVRCNIHGNVICNLPDINCYSSIVLEPDAINPTACIIVNCGSQGLIGISPDGIILWKRPDLYGRLVATIHWQCNKDNILTSLFQPLHPPLANSKSKDNPTSTRHLWPCLIDREGRTHEPFPWHNENEIEAPDVQSPCSEDHGFMYGVQGCDLNHDSDDEVIVSNRDHLWIFAARNG